MIVNNFNDFRNDFCHTWDHDFFYEFGLTVILTPAAIYNQHKINPKLIAPRIIYINKERVDFFLCYNSHQWISSEFLRNLCARNKSMKFIDLSVTSESGKLSCIRFNIGMP